MEFERFKAALEEGELESDVYERLRWEYVAHIRKKARLMEFKIVMRDIIETLASIFCIAVFASLLEPGQSNLARAGVVLMIADAVFIVAAFHTVRIRYRVKRFDLPKKSFLLMERDKVDAQIRLMRRYTSSVFIPMLAGGVLYFVSMNPTTSEAILFVGGLVGFSALGSWVQKRKIRTELLPFRDEINRHLREFNGNEA
jgi:hypothetical protein